MAGTTFRELIHIAKALAFFLGCGNATDRFSLLNICFIATVWSDNSSNKQSAWNRSTDLQFRVIPVQYT